MIIGYILHSLGFGIGAQEKGIRVEMKKALIAVLVTMMVFCTAAFAKDGVENYSGLGVGFGISRSNINDGDRYWKTNQLQISFSDFGFIKRSPVGLFVDVSIVINTSRVSTGGGLPDYTWPETPIGLMATLGPAFKFETGKKTDIILGVGFQFYSEKQNHSTYYDECSFMGLGFDVEAAYNVNKDFAITLGASGSFFFINNIRMMFPYLSPIDASYDSYIEYRVVPRVMAYYVY